MEKFLNLAEKFILVSVVSFFIVVWVGFLGGCILFVLRILL